MKINTVINPDKRKTIYASDYEVGTVVKSGDRLYLVGKASTAKWLFPIQHENSSMICCKSVSPGEVVVITAVEVYSKYSQ